MSFSESSIGQCIEAAQALILKWNPDTSFYAKFTSLFYEDESEAMHYIQCVSQLHKAMHFLISHHNPPSSDKLNLANNLMQMAMKRLQKEFYQILSINRAHLDPESVSTRSSHSHATSLFSSTSDYDDDRSTTPDDDVRAAADSISEVGQGSSVAMSNLRSIAECMISSGYGKECLSVYKIIRKSIIDEGIHRLNLEKLSSSHINKMDWQVLELKINTWLEAVKVSVRTLFNGERILCDHVFASSESIRESCFADISRDGATLLFTFPELVSKTKKSPPEKMFRVLDMYTAITALMPAIQSIFSFNSTSEISSQVLHLPLRLSESVRTMLSEFESTIQKDSSKSPVRDGGVTPLTTQAMNYVALLADYSDVLSDIFADWPPPPKVSSPESFLDSPDSVDMSAAPSFSVRIAWLILVLLCKLDSQAKHCKDISLSYLFLANNLQHVINRARNSNLQYVLGGDWVVKHEVKLKRFVTNYEKVAWGEVFSCLPENPKAVMSPAEAKVIFRNFNFHFEEVYRKQISFTVPDRRQRDEIIGSIGRKIVPVYGEFYDTHRMTVGSVREMTGYVTFTPDDVENYLANLFIVAQSLHHQTG